MGLVFEGDEEAPVQGLDCWRLAGPNDEPGVADAQDQRDVVADRHAMAGRAEGHRRLDGRPLAGCAGQGVV